MVAVSFAAAAEGSVPGPDTAAMLGKETTASVSPIDESAGPPVEDGSDILMKLTVTNRSEYPITNILMYGIVQHPGDPLGTAGGFGSVSVTARGAAVYYTQADPSSTDVKKYGAYGSDIHTLRDAAFHMGEGWSSAEPDDPSAFFVDYGGHVLEPGEGVEILLTFTLPAEGAMVHDHFIYSATSVDGTLLLDLVNRSSDNFEQRLATDCDLSGDIVLYGTENLGESGIRYQDDSWLWGTIAAEVLLISAGVLVWLTLFFGMPGLYVTVRQNGKAIKGAIVSYTVTNNGILMNAAKITNAKGKCRIKAKNGSEILILHAEKDGFTAADVPAVSFDGRTERMELTLE